MGKVNPNNAVGIIEGRVGDLIFVRYADGRHFHLRLSRSGFPAPG